MKTDLIRNFIYERTQFLRRFLDAPKRSMDEECGHPEYISMLDYRRKFDRGDIAHRVVSIFPEDCWSRPPLVYETEDDTETPFEAGWAALNKEFSITSFLLRADILSGIGRFGVIMLGLDDGAALDQPVPDPVPASGYKLLYLRAFDESLIHIKEVDRNPQSPRFGAPTLYEIKVGVNLDTTYAAAPAASAIGSKVVGSTIVVHWTRVIHLADNRLSDEIYGTPRLQKVYDRILDLHKIAGGSGEMFWKGGFPGLALQGIPSDEPVQLDKEATKDEMEAYYEGLKRYIALEGMTAQSLAPQISDPTAHAELQIKLTAAAIGCPWRVFMGSEVGQLASGQDMVSWNIRLQKRRTEYLTPFVLRPFLNRLIYLKILPFPAGSGDGTTPDYIIYWDDLNTPSRQEKADVAVKIVDAIVKYIAGNGDQLIAPVHFLELVAGFSREEVISILEEVETRLEDERIVAEPLEDDLLEAPRGASVMVR